MTASLNHLGSLPVRFKQRPRKLSVDEERIFQVSIRSRRASTDGKLIFSYHTKFNEQSAWLSVHITHPVFGES